MPLVITPLQPTLTLAQKQAKKCQLIRASTTRIYQAIAREVPTIAELIFDDNDQTNFSPQQVLNLLGPDAGPLVTDFGTLAALVNAQVPGTLPPSPKPLTVNSDGTVTVGA